MRFWKIFLLSLLLVAMGSLPAQADDSDNNIDNNTPLTAPNASCTLSDYLPQAVIQHQSIDPNDPTLVFHCPPVSCLVKDSTNLTWSAPGGFKSYQKSFVQNVSVFLGVQWEGIRVGQIICTYQGVEKVTFPLAVVYNQLTFEPEVASNASNIPTWSKNLGGYRNCKSSSINDCPFRVMVKQSTQDVYQEAAQLKPSTPSGS